MDELKCKFGTFLHESGSKLLIFTIDNGDLDLEMIDEFEKSYYQVADSFEGPFIMVFDGTKGKWLSSSVRIKLGKASKAIEIKYSDRLKYNFIAIPNPIVKMMLKGVNLVAKPDVPQTLFPSKETAITAANNEVKSW